MEVLRRDFPEVVEIKIGSQRPRGLLNKLGNSAGPLLAQLPRQAFSLESHPACGGGPAWVLSAGSRCPRGHAPVAPSSAQGWSASFWTDNIGMLPHSLCRSLDVPPHGGFPAPNLDAHPPVLSPPCASSIPGCEYPSPLPHTDLCEGMAWLVYSVFPAPGTGFPSRRVFSKASVSSWMSVSYRPGSKLTTNLECVHGKTRQQGELLSESQPYG